MITVIELKDWLKMLPDDSHIAVDEGGLNLVEIDENGEESGNCLEIGGIPDWSDESNWTSGDDWADKNTAL